MVFEKDIKLKPVRNDSWLDDTKNTFEHISDIDEINELFGSFEKKKKLNL